LTSSTLYIDHDRGLQRLHPLTKLVVTLFLVVLAFLLPSMWAGYVVFLLGVVPLALWGGILRPLWSALWKIVLPFAISMFVIQGLFWTGGTPVVSLGPLSLKAEGLVFATTITGRLLAIMGSFLLFSLGTPPDDLMISLEERGVPNSVTYIILSTIQLVPGLQVRAGKIRDAQRARGLETEGNIFQRMRSMLPLVEPLVLGSIIDVDERAIALEARGFSSNTPKTFFRTVEDRRWEQIFRWALLILSVILILVRLFWPLISRYWGDGG
jgi:energy-coupling factor transport system permease protein